MLIQFKLEKETLLKDRTKIDGQIKRDRGGGHRYQNHTVVIFIFIQRNTKKNILIQH